MQKKQDNDALPADIGGASWYDTLVLYMTLVVALAGAGAIVYGGVSAIRDSVRRARAVPDKVKTTDVRAKNSANTISYSAAQMLQSQRSR